MMQIIRCIPAVLLAAVLSLDAAATSHVTSSDFTSAEVRKVDKEAAKVTLRHGPIVNLEMPPMTMVFRVRERSMLDDLKVGDRVRFKADKVQGAYTVTEITR